MGFNNGGVEQMVQRLKKNKDVLIGGNIGKNKLTPNEEAVNDYKICFEALFDYVDYFVVNVRALPRLQICGSCRIKSRLRACWIPCSK